MEKIHTIELNLDDDYASSCAYHIDDLMSTIKRNVLAAENNDKTDRWMLVGLANSLSEASDKAQELRLLLCERNNKKPLSLDF